LVYDLDQNPEDVHDSAGDHPNKLITLIKSPMEECQKATQNPTGLANYTERGCARYLKAILPVAMGPKKK